ncbi:actin-related protein 6-like [Teratosphaeria destructans]|uniref:Actin-like protein ARP6 n=1 Tax=Teratosphaeria destructans TaxID=418781 RepID=A0A9W7VZ52_9PEZI|nr:actin-related protein 6-like [Teratosphaeria destructans]
MARTKSLSTTTTALAPGDLAARTLVLDNGAHSLKAGFATHASPILPADLPAECRVVPNCIAKSDRDRRSYVGAELSEECEDYGELKYRRPVEKGYIVNWESEKAIWEKTFLTGYGQKSADRGGVGEGLVCNPAETNLLLTEAPNAPAALQRNCDEIVFEEFCFGAFYRCLAPALCAYAPSPFPDTAVPLSGQALECLLVVDTGHSYTTVTPLYQGRPFNSAIRRLEVGGKTLTNQMKELISRTFDVHKEDQIVQEIKEDVCYVCPTSQDFADHLERTWKGGRYDPRTVDPSIVVDYVLPDYETIKRGEWRKHDPRVNLRNSALGIGTRDGRREHILTIGNERFAVPELLFTPTDIGMQQDGIAGTILQSISALPAGLKQAYLANILIVGGTASIKGLCERVETELRGMVEDHLVIKVAKAADAVKNAWLGGARMAQNEEVMKRVVVTKGEYDENGHVWLRRRFAGKVGR